ncbi:MAG TPA: 4-hydroxy-tetrahydrodipicolinate synthase [Nitrospiria bacterium]
MYSGSLVAIVTPFKEGRFDEKAFGEMIEFQIAEGSSGIIPCGTTGESATLSHEEHNRVVELTVELVRGRVPVIAGTGSNSTREAIALTAHAKKVGADGALLISPYYNKPSQDGLYQHFTAIARAVDFPLTVYNIPGRTGVNILPQTLERMVSPGSGEKNIVAVKEASGSLAQVSEVIRRCGDRLAVLSGDDPLTLPILSLGGRGVISASANILPREFAQMIQSGLKNDWDAARRIHYKMAPLVDSLFLETNPVPVKTALGILGKCSDEVRQPLSPLTQGNRTILEKALKDYGLI